jgi:archaellum component FlaC
MGLGYLFNHLSGIKGIDRLAASHAGRSLIAELRIMAMDVSEFMPEEVLNELKYISPKAGTGNMSYVELGEVAWELFTRLSSIMGNFEAAYDAIAERALKAGCFTEQEFGASGEKSTKIRASIVFFAYVYAMKETGFNSGIIFHDGINLFSFGLKKGENDCDISTPTLNSMLTAKGVDCAIYEIPDHISTAVFVNGNPHFHVESLDGYMPLEDGSTLFQDINFLLQFDPGLKTGEEKELFRKSFSFLSEEVITVPLPANGVVMERDYVRSEFSIKAIDIKCERQRLKKDMDQLHEKMEQPDNVLTQLCEKMEGLKKEMAIAKEGGEATHSQAKDLEKNAESSTMAVEEYNETIMRYNAKIKEFDDKYDELRTTYYELYNNYNQLKVNYDEQMNNYESLKAKRGELNEKLRDLKTQNPDASWIVVP